MTRRAPNFVYPLSLFLASLALRLAWLRLAAGDPYFSTLVIDAESYHKKALEVLSGHFIGPRAFYQDALYPYILALAYHLFGTGIATARVLNALLSAGTTAAIYGIGKDLGGRRAGVVAALFHLSCGLFLFYDAILGKEPLAVLLTSAALLAALRAAGRPSRLRFLGAGALLGLAALTRANLLLFVPVFCGWALLALERPRGLRAVFAALYAAGFLAAVFPATLHNYLAEGDFVLLTSQGGQNFYYGNGPEAAGTFQDPARVRLIPEHEEEDFRREAQRLSGREEMNSGEVSRFWLGRGLDWVLSHPAATLALAARKTAMFFSALEIPDNYSFAFAETRAPLLRFLFTSSGLLLILGIPGLALLFPGRRRFLVPVLFFVTYAASVIAFHVASRYRLPVLPLLCASSAVLLTEGASLARARNLRRLAPPLAALVLASCAVLYPYSFVPADESKTFDQPYNALGTAAAERGDQAGAIAWYEKALAINPNNAAVLLNRGESLRKLGRADEAEASYREAVRLSPDLSDARYDLGMLLATNGRAEAALSVFDEALARNGRDPLAHAGRGYALILLSRLAEARDALARAVSLDPSLASAHYNLACVLARTGRSSEAWTELAAAARLDPALPEKAAHDPDLAPLGPPDAILSRLAGG